MDPQAIFDNYRRAVTQHYFDMAGRVGRSEFWYFVLANFVFAIIAAILQSGGLPAAAGALQPGDAPAGRRHGRAPPAGHRPRWQAGLGLHHRRIYFPALLG